MDPLAQLNDIHLPENIHSYPIAPGWWLLAALILTLTIYGAIKLRQYIAKRKCQKNALKQLSTNADVGTIVTLLKWAALQYFPRQTVANLTGEHFKSFLTSTLPAKYQADFSKLSADYFTSAYQHQSSSKASAEFHQAAKLWLNHALPPQKNVLSTLTPMPEQADLTSKNDTTSSASSSPQLTERNGVKS